MLIGDQRLTPPTFGGNADIEREVVAGIWRLIACYGGRNSKRISVDRTRSFIRTFRDMAQKEPGWLVPKCCGFGQQASLQYSERSLARCCRATQRARSRHTSFGHWERYFSRLVSPTLREPPQKESGTERLASYSDTHDKSNVTSVALAILPKQWISHGSLLARV